jgi:pimeloyl-ACP methyl ester carboxylesterase
MSATPSSRTVDLSHGRRIEILEAGSGTPLFFLHGAGGIPQWDGVLPILASRFHVYAPLLPGYGASVGLDAIDDHFDLFFHCYDVLDALGLERPYVVGESLGGWLAAEMAALRPKEIGRLALAAPIGLWRDAAPIVDLFGYTTNELVPFLFHDPACGAAQQMLGVGALLSDKDDRSEAQVEFLLSLARGFRTLAKFLFPIPERGLERRLHRIVAPTLVVWGTDDRFVQPSYARIFLDAIPDARLVTIPNAGHLIGAEQPKPYGDALLSFGQGQ